MQGSATLLQPRQVAGVVGIESRPVQRGGFIFCQQVAVLPILDFRVTIGKRQASAISVKCPRIIDPLVEIGRADKESVINAI